jgi:hypothetical protein
VIYFVSPLTGGDVKIGTTARLSQRLANLRSQRKTGLRVLGVMDGGREREAELHELFAHLRGHGEWFRPGDELLEYVRQNARPWDGADEAPPRHTGTLALPRALFDALEAHAAKDMRTKKAVVVLALQAYLRSQGAWPPPAQGGG